MKYDVIIVGAGMAGMTAGIYAGRAGLKTLVLEGSLMGGQIVNSFSVENWPGEVEISGADLMKRIYAQMTGLGVEAKNEEVVETKDNGDDSGGRFLVKTDEDEYTCNAMIIATGTEPRKLEGVQKESAGEKPVLYCATCDGALYKGKTVAVVGEGNTAKHEIKYLEGICEKVYNVHRGEMIPEEAEAVFVAIGRVPATGTFEDLVKLDSDGYVMADEKCETSRPGVFVAGDCRTKPARQLVTAAGDGAVAVNGVVRYLRK